MLHTGGCRKCSRGNPNDRHLALNATSTKAYGVSTALEHDIKSASTIGHISFKIQKGQGFLDHKNIHKEDKKLKLMRWDTRCTSPGPLWKGSTQTHQPKHTPTPLLLLSSSYSPLFCAFFPLQNKASPRNKVLQISRQDSLPFQFHSDLLHAILTTKPEDFAIKGSSREEGSEPHGSHKESQNRWS